MNNRIEIDHTAYPKKRILEAIYDWLAKYDLIGGLVLLILMVMEFFYLVYINHC